MRTLGNDDPRGNISSGATTHCRTLTTAEKNICDQVGPVGRDKGLIFVGIDLIGGYLTEINVTSPTGICELDRLSNLDIAQELMQTIEALVQERRAGGPI